MRSWRNYRMKEITLKFKYQKESDLDDLFSRLNDWESHAEGPASYGTFREQT